MKTGYDQFFKNARNAAEGKPPASASLKNRKEKSQQHLTRKRRKRVKFPTFALFVSMMGFFLAYAGYINYDKISLYLNKVDFSMLTFASAEEGHSPKTEKSETATVPQNFTKPVVAEPSGEDLNHLMKLVERKKELDAREEELNRMEAEMSKQKDDLQKKVADLEKIRTSISAMLEERVKTDDKKIETLVQFYSNMKPPQAAKVFETLDEDLAVQILGRMKKKSAADILNLMKPEKAQMFTERFAGYKRTMASEPEKNTPADQNAQNDQGGSGSDQAAPQDVPSKP